MSKTGLRRYVPLAIFIAAVFATAFFGAQFLPGSWYAALKKPSWNPPGWLFGPVWTLLYVAIAVSAWRVYERLPPRSWAPIGLWFVQLIPNALWSYFFFGAHRMDWALIDILVLLCLIGSTAALFYRYDRIAGWLFVPYFLWVAFASTLNWALYWLNAV